MSPELACEERELTELREQALGRLPALCRRTDLMVREDEETDQRAALRFGLPLPTVGVHVGRAQQRFRRELATRGISSQAGRPSRVRRRQGRWQSEMPEMP
jgi:DNA-directed RNA polymerase specialized sigma24 family protein